MEAYKERFIEEYKDTLKRTVKLENMLTKYDNGTLEFMPTCPIDLLKHQLDVMKDYLAILEERAGIEDVELSFVIKMHEE